ncbi:MULTISPECIES: ligand-gated channel protein [Enterobacterales]|uniref:ligand-gated channel protein n=1 Tax=Enterobacterales TaxID=91347 RepID=UPI000847E024|nr:MULTISPECIES: ligand-gated channel protein [Enterobacterales]WOO51183.1 ligand-gated channel protein [Hafnia alvei]MCT6516610.1 ligand-gated channel protein [Proteus vulgaris]ODQ06542.1 ligand-gated channel protein [Shigella sp. FC130]OEI94128.1 ligand-gated channel protein [Shigella sp. FC1655]OEJ07595.1 ligand-gated channel protein [Shigella sp. FC1967]
MVVLNKNKIALGVVAAIASSFVMTASAENVEKLLVTTASGFKQTVEDAPASVSVVTREQLETKSYRDVTDALKDVPGVLVTGGGSSSDISIRGMDAKYTMILVDGKRVASRETRPNSDNAGIEQGWLPPLPAIERIEVVRGPMSSLYGSDAMGGVINIITRKAQKEWNVSLRADSTLTERQNSGNTEQGSFYAAGPLIDNLLGLKVQGQYSHRSEDKFVNGYNRQITASGGGTLSWTPDDKNTVEFEFKKDSQHRDARWEYSASERSRKSKNSDFSKYELTQYALTHDGIYDFGTMNTYIQRDENNNPSRKMKYNDTTVRNQTVFMLDAHTLSVGAQYRYEELKDEGNKLKDSNKLDRYSWALFAEDEWAMTNDFALTGGLRMDKDENYGTHWTPRVYGVWHMADEWTLKGGVSTGYRSPDLRQATKTWGQATGGSGGNAVIYGNPDLKPEKSVTEEIGIIWDNRDNLTASVTIYNTDFKDKITERRICDDKGVLPTCTKEQGYGHQYDFISTRENVDKANMRGIEVTGNWVISPEWNLAANYTFTDSEQKSGAFSGKPLNKQPRHMANATLNWETTPEMETWARINFRGKTSDYLSRTSMSHGTPSYAFVDIGTSYSLTKQLNVIGGVYNVLDRRINYENFNTTLEGRRYNIGLNYNF